jgi:hypothetical protein
MTKLPNPATEWASDSGFAEADRVRAAQNISAPNSVKSWSALEQPLPREAISSASVNSALGSGLNVGDANHAGRFVYGSGHVHLLAFKLLRLCLVIKLIGHSVRF